MDKNYVDTHGGGGGTITGATNGLSVSGKNIELGGNLLKDTYINLCGHQFIVSGNSQYSDFIGGVDFYTRGECFTVYGDNGSCVEKTKLQISDTQAIFTDSRSTPVGIQYNDDYSATYSSCSLVDKNYVDTHGGGGGTITGATNGLSVSGKNIELGGNLLKDTYINLDNNYLNIINGIDFGSGFNDFVRPIAIQNDGKILVGGSFTTYSGVSANYIIRLNTDGTIDNTFDNGSGFNNHVYTLAIQSDGKILVGGHFSQYSGVSIGFGIIRLNTDGSIDNTFVTGSGFNGNVYSIAIQSNGKILVGGWFTVYSGVTVNYIVRLNTDGTIDNTFVTGGGFNNSINSIVIQSDGKILAGGYFTLYSGVTANFIIRLNTDGTIDNTFKGAGTYEVEIITIQDDGKIIIGGLFTHYSGVTANRIVRLNTDGTIDNTFNTGSGFNIQTVQSIAIQNDGRILVGGYFSQYSGVTANSIIRLNGDGTIDNTFKSGSGFDNEVWSIIVQSNSKILVGGWFTAYSGVTVGFAIIRLNIDGSIDSGQSYKVTFNNKVIEYGADYSSDYTDRSLVDKEYVDTHGGSGISEFTISGNSSSTGFTVNHAKNKQFVAVEVVQGLSPYATVYTNVQRTDANNVCITFDTAPLSGTCYKILVIG